MTDGPLDEKAIFDVARKIDSQDARAQYLNQVCGDDQALFDRVVALAGIHDKKGSFLEVPAAQISPTLDQPVTEKAGTTIDHYKLLEQIGEGGFGVVFMAEQQEPVRRKVALKIIKPGMDTKEVIARFEAERQALALMDHPNIARVLDAGATESGRPYFVMELVRGISITDYCDQNDLSARERLELFGSVCQAVQHAHQKGIIHRDIKPSNVMITLRDDTPVAKVIDFGVSKATNARMTEKTLFTRFGQMVGTPLYMSPEQAGMNELDVDTRSDIYSLGVLLYELLTGTTPFDQQRFRQAAYDELLHIIRDEEPPKPSIRVSTLGEAAITSSAHRKTDPKRLSQFLCGELDWIVMKALEKDRTRRYETANSFARDVERYLNDEPVSACPPSTSYRFRKFARRNKAAFVTTAAIAAILIAGIIGTSWQAYRATRQRDRAVNAEQLAENRLQREQRERRRAEQAEDHATQEAQRADMEAEKARTEAAIAAAVNEFLNNDLLGMADAESQAEADISPDPNIKLRTVIDRAAARIEGQFPDQPKVEAAIRSTLSTTYRSIGIYDKAEEQAERTLELGRQELGAEHPATLMSMSNLACTISDQGGYAEAEKLHRNVLEIRKRTLGDEHPDTLGSMSNLAGAYYRQHRYAEAEELNRQTLQIRRRTLGDEHRDTLGSMLNLAVVYYRQHRYAEAEQLQQKTLEVLKRTLGVEHPDTLSSMSNLALVCHALGRHAEAEQLQQETLEIQRRTLGDEHPTTLISMNNLANTIALSNTRGQHRYAEAEKLHRNVLEIRKRTLGDEHPDTVQSIDNLGLDLVKQGKLDEGIECFQKAIQLEPGFVKAHFNLGCALAEKGKPDEAIVAYKRAIELNPKLMRAYNNLGIALTIQGKADEAIGCYLKAIELDPNYPLAHTNLGVALVKQGKPAEAIAHHQKATELDPNYALAHQNLGVALARLGKLNEAMSMYRRAIELEPNAGSACNNLAWHLVTAPDPSLRNPAEALELARRSTKIKPDKWERWNTLSRAAFETGNWAESVEARQKKAEIRGAANPKDKLYLAMAHWHLCNQTEARKWYAKAVVELARKPDSRANTLRDEAEQLMGIKPADRRASVLDYLGRAIEAEPHNAELLSQRGLLFLQTGELKQAEEDLTKALELEPLKGEFFVTRGELYSRQEEWDLAIDDYGQVIELDPEDAGAWYRRANAHFQKGDLDNAIADCAEAVRFDPTYAIAYKRRGQAYYAKGELDLAIADHTEAIRLQSGQAHYYAARAQAYLAKGDPDRAIVDCTEAIRLDPNRGPEYRKRAQAHVELGKWEKAVNDLERSAELGDQRSRFLPVLLLVTAGDTEGYRRACARLYERFGQSDDPKIADWLAWVCKFGPKAIDDLERALKSAQTAVASDPGSIRYHNNYAGVLHRSGRYREAAEQLNEAMRLRGGEGTVWEWIWLAMVHHRLGNVDEARQWLDKARSWIDQSVESKSWHIRIELQLLRREAEGLMNQTSEAKKAATDAEDPTDKERQAEENVNSKS